MAGEIFSETLILRIKCHTWQHAPAVATEYVQIVRQLGSNEDMRLWAEGYVHGHAGRLLWDVDFLTANYSIASCLNVGGAPFLFEYLLSKSRPDVRLVSLDLDPSRFPRAAEILRAEVLKIDVERGSATTMAGLGQFDCLVFCEIFEHLRIDILRTMKLLGGLMAPQGILYLTMPNGLGLSAWTKFVRGHTGPDPVLEWRKLSQLGHMGHVREYSISEIESVLKECGFHLDQYFFRRQSTLRGTIRSRIRETGQLIATNLVPSLGDEIGLVARRSA